MFRGSIVALVTPFRNGAIDEDALQSLVNWHVEQGTHGLVPVGTTGESPTLSHAEHERVVEVVIAAADRRLPAKTIAEARATGTRVGRDLQKARELAATERYLEASETIVRSTTQINEQIQALNEAGKSKPVRRRR